MGSGTGGETISTGERILVAAAELTAEVGWGHVTMGRLAGRVGVSRQTLYNEFGPKHQLAEAMVIHELGRFLAGAAQAFARHPTDLGAALAASNRAVLELAARDATLQAVLTASFGHDADLLRLLTSHGTHLQETAAEALHALLAPYHPPLSAGELAAAVDMLVRMLLSHAILSDLSHREAADRITWLGRRVLGV